MTMVWILLLAAAWGAGVFFLRKHRIWIFYYLIGTTGLAALLVYLTRTAFHAEILLAKSVAYSIHWISHLLNIPTQIFEEAPGLLLVLVVVQRVGWTALEIGVESSALLEACVLFGLVSFYPGWNWLERGARLAIGLVFTWLANLLRMFIIVLMLHLMGKEVLVLAHTFIGKLVFFVCTIGIYWYLITLPSLKLIRKNITERNRV
ncbi:MAG: hypothetical protein JW750_10210 [Anaerolineaceae bacterium]|nr:hypothetical protein [Anaerolineaceae bacterium]